MNVRKYSMTSLLSIAFSFAGLAVLFALFNQVDLGYEASNSLIKLYFSLLILFSVCGIILAIFGFSGKDVSKILPIVGLLLNLIFLLIPFAIYLLLWAHHLSETGG